MRIVGGIDIHRKQLTFDYVDLETGQLFRGRVAPADRWHLAVWLRRFAGVAGVHFAIEACTGWRYVAEELCLAGVVVHLAEPADTATARGRRRKAKTDPGDAQQLRELLTDGRLSECWVAPAHVLECRALLQLYQDLRVEHTGWVRRIHAVCFHQGTPELVDGVHTAAARQQLAVLSGQLSAAGREQVATAVAMLETLEEHMDRLRRSLGALARRLTGARMLAENIYGVGPLTGLALCCWLGGADRFSSARKAVRFAGLDITVYSSDGKRRPGRLSRQGPALLRWLLYEAAKASARASAPDHRYYTQVCTRIDSKRAALSQARRIVRQASHVLAELGDDALALDPTSRTTTPALTAALLRPTG